MVGRLISQANARVVSSASKLAVNIQNIYISLGNRHKHLHLSVPCKTVGDAGRPCIFPFKYADNTYDKCTSKDSDNGQPWCATEVDDEGYVVDNAWGDCLEGCPGSSKQIRVLLICTDLYYS